MIKVANNNTDMQLSLFEGEEVPVEVLTEPFEEIDFEEQEELDDILPGQLNLFDFENVQFI